MRTRHAAGISVRLRFSDDARLGPGKIALLEAVARTGSTAEAARQMGMSDRRAGLLIDSLNRMFVEPVVLAGPASAADPGAALSETGRVLVSAYRAMEADAARAVEHHFGPLRARMAAQEGQPGDQPRNRAGTTACTSPGTPPDTLRG
jgi:molybdate transport system regulatory protein